LFDQHCQVAVTRCLTPSEVFEPCNGQPDAKGNQR
jgi:hypothetical protein